jgi:hypothetical protein
MKDKAVPGYLGRYEAEPAVSQFDSKQDNEYLCSSPFPEQICGP